MPVTVIVELSAKPGVVDEVKSILVNEILPGTRQAPGCQSIELYSNQDDPTSVIAIQLWDKREDYEAYLAKRDAAGTGTKGRLADMLSGQRQIRFFDHEMPV